MELGPRLGRRRMACAEIGVKGLGQRRSGLGVELFEPVNGGGWCALLLNGVPCHGLSIAEKSGPEEAAHEVSANLVQPEASWRPNSMVTSGSGRCFVHRLLVNRSSPRRMVKSNRVNRSGPDLFPAACFLKKWFSSAQSEKPRAFGLDAGEIYQPPENEVIFMVKDLPIKWNLMPEFFHLLGRAKVR